MFVSFFCSVILLSSCCNAGDWKESLDFVLDGREVNHVTPFQRGLCDYEKQTTENLAPPRGKLDNVGNAVLSAAEYAAGDRSRTNTKNIALASLQVILENGESRFTHIENQGAHLGKPHNATTDPRLFYSFGKEPGSHSTPTNKLFLRIQGRFKGKIGEHGTTYALPSSLDTCIDTYHQEVHSEERIFYELGELYEYKGQTKPGYKHYIDDILAGSAGVRISAVVLHLHTRFDMCGICAYSLSWELQKGFGKGIVDYCFELNGEALPKFSALVSSRQNHLVWKNGRRTLPSGPPLPTKSLPDASIYRGYVGEIDLGELSTHKKFAQWAVPSFLPPIAPGSSLFYDFGNLFPPGKVLIDRPPAVVATSDSGGASAGAGTGAGGGSTSVSGGGAPTSVHVKMSYAAALGKK